MKVALFHGEQPWFGRPQGADHAVLAAQPVAVQKTGSNSSKRWVEQGRSIEEIEQVLRAGADQAKKSALEIVTAGKSLEAVLHPGVKRTPGREERSSWPRRSSSTWSSTMSLSSFELARAR